MALSARCPPALGGWNVLGARERVSIVEKRTVRTGGASVLIDAHV